MIENWDKGPIWKPNNLYFGVQSWNYHDPVNINKNHDNCFWGWRLGKRPPGETPSPWANIHQIFLIGTLVRYRRQLRNSIGVSGHWNLRSPAMLSNRKISYVFIFRIEFHTMWVLYPQRYNLKICLLFFTNFKLSSNNCSNVKFSTTEPKKKFSTILRTRNSKLCTNSCFPNFFVLP